MTLDTKKGKLGLKIKRSDKVTKIMTLEEVKNSGKSVNWGGRTLYDINGAILKEIMEYHKSLVNYYADG